MTNYFFYYLKLYLKSKTNKVHTKYIMKCLVYLIILLGTVEIVFNERKEVKMLHYNMNIS